MSLLRWGSKGPCCALTVVNRPFTQNPGHFECNRDVTPDVTPAIEETMRSCPCTSRMGIHEQEATLASTTRLDRRRAATAHASEIEKQKPRRLLPKGSEEELYVTQWRNNRRTSCGEEPCHLGTRLSPTLRKGARNRSFDACKRNSPREVHYPLDGQLLLTGMSQVCAFASPFFASMSAMKMLCHLLAPKCLHGINLCGVASRDIAGEKRHGDQQ
jgi:hypothetical protein